MPPRPTSSPAQLQGLCLNQPFDPSASRIFRGFSGMRLQPLWPTILAFRQKHVVSDENQMQFERVRGCFLASVVVVAFLFLLLLLASLCAVRPKVGRETPPCLLTCLLTFLLAILFVLLSRTNTLLACLLACLLTVLLACSLAPLACRTPAQTAFG